MISNLEISLNTLVDWRSFCSEVADPSFSEQKPIGGVGVEIEIDETFRDVNHIIKNSLKMPGSRGRIGPGGGPKGATPPGRN